MPSELSKCKMMVAFSMLQQWCVMVQDELSVSGGNDWVISEWMCH